MTDQLLRFTDSTELANRAAGMLVTQIAHYQQDPDRIVHLCLTGGRIAQRVYESFGGRLEAAGASEGVLFYGALHALGAGCGHAL